MPQTLTSVGDDVDWASAPHSRGDAIFWPYGGDYKDIRLNKIGYYLFSWNMECTGVTDNDHVQFRLWGADPDNVTTYQKAFVTSGFRAGIQQSFISYISSKRTIEASFMAGTDGMDWRGQLQIVYMGT